MKQEWQQKILDKSIPEPNSGCWFWLGYVDRNGYGKFGPSQFNILWAHRGSYEAFVGEIPPGMHTDHKCKTRCCVNPDHLEIVTQAENNRRAVKLRMANKLAKRHLHPPS